MSAPSVQSGLAPHMEPDAGHPPGIMTMVATLASAIITISLIIALQGYFFFLDWKEIERKNLNVDYKELGEHETAEETALSSLNWIDRENGTVRVPVERSLEAVRSRYGGKNDEPSRSMDELRKERGIGEFEVKHDDHHGHGHDDHGHDDHDDHDHDHEDH